MIINTHKLIAKDVHKNIKDIFNIELNKKNFIYGNIKPDIVPRLRNIPHYIDNSLGFVINEIDRLCTIENIDMDKFSTDLGVITHYISDFFCSPHYFQKEYNKNIIQHVKYEIELHFKYMKLRKKQLLNINDIKLYTTKSNSVLKLLYSLQNSYSTSTPSFENDIYYSTKASTLISLLVISNSLVKLEEKSVA